MNMIKSGQHARRLFVPILLFEGGFMFRPAFPGDDAFTASVGRRVPDALVTADGKRAEIPTDEALRKLSSDGAKVRQRG